MREAESRWITKRFSKEEAGRKWKEESPKGYKLRDELLDTLRFAYRKNSELTGRVQAIAEGTGHADMIQDLNDLAVLGRNNIPPLEAINQDLSILDEAAALAAELGTLFAEATGENSVAEKNIRDKAYSYLKQAVDEICDYGKFIFRDNDERRRGYISAYLKKINRRGRKNQDNGEAVEN